MSDKSFTIKTVYVLSGIRKTGERVYFAIDSHSGGYPYWSEAKARAMAEIEKIQAELASRIAALGGMK